MDPRDLSALLPPTLLSSASLGLEESMFILAATASLTEAATRVLAEQPGGSPVGCELGGGWGWGWHGGGG